MRVKLNSNDNGAIDATESFLNNAYAADAMGKPVDKTYLSALEKIFLNKIL